MNADSQVEEHEIEMTLGSVVLKGMLALVPGATGLVLFVHGSGSSRFSSRNRFVAGDLQLGGLSTLLFDLLSTEEERVDQFTRELRFDVGLLTRRVVGVTDWLQQNPETRTLGIGTHSPHRGRRRPRRDPVEPAGFRAPDGAQGPEDRSGRQSSLRRARHPGGSIPFGPRVVPTQPGCRALSRASPGAATTRSWCARPTARLGSLPC